MSSKQWAILAALFVSALGVIVCLCLAIVLASRGRTQNVADLQAVASVTSSPVSPAPPIRTLRPTAAPSPRSTATQPPAPTAAKTLSPSDALGQLAQDGLKQDGIGHMFLTLKSTALNGITATVDYATSDIAIDQETSVAPFMGHLQYIVPQVFSQFSSVGVVVVRESTGLVDTYGQKSEGIVIVLSITRATNSKIDWQNFRPKNLPKVLTAKNEVFAVGPALSDGWTTYQQKY